MDPVLAEGFAVVADDAEDRVVREPEAGQLDIQGLEQAYAAEPVAASV